MKGFSKYLIENHVPRYFIMGLICVKFLSIYEKFRIVVAVNQMTSSMIFQKTKELRPHFDSEQEFQDLLTKRILEDK